MIKKKKKFTAALFIIGKNGNNPNVHEEVNDKHSGLRKYLLLNNKNKLLMLITTWMNHKNTTVRVNIRYKKSAHCMISFM